MTRTNTNACNDPAIRSWVERANAPGSDFPIQNLPYGVFTHAGHREEERRIGVAIGDRVLDLKECETAGLLGGLSPGARCALHAAALNDLMKQGRAVWSELRNAVSSLLREDNPALRDDPSLAARVLLAQSDAVMHLPAEIGDYTDFYASVHHATNIGSMFRPDNPLLPNYKWLPVGYHGRASSIIISGTPVRRPKGQIRPSDDDPPTFDACRLLDYEMEMGAFIGPGNDLGSRISMREAREHLFGMVIVNDWSARDIQKWEYVPLGPFNAKNFATTISPWVVTFDALEPYLIDGPPRENLVNEDPPTLEYLKPAGPMSIDMTCEVWIASKKMRDAGTGPFMLSRGNFREMYWTFAQMLAHHTSTGCPMRPGDLIASGTLSGRSEDSRGSLLERSWRGQNPIDLPDGTQRKLLQDGDEVIMRAYCAGEGRARVGFGECRGAVESAQ